MEETSKKQVILYSAEKHATTGNGTFAETIAVEDIPARKQLQKEINTTWKSKQKKEFKQYKPEPAELPKFENLRLDEGTGNTLFLLGSSKAGKSFALMKIYAEYYKKSKNLITVLFTDSPQSPHYKQLLKKNLVIHPENGFDASCNDLIMKIKSIQSNFNNPVDFLLMFDDVINIRYASIIERAVCVYRNSNISTIISTQYPKLVNKSLRANINNIMLFRFNTDEAIEVALKTFCGSEAPFRGHTPDDKIAIYRELTKDYHFIYMNPANQIMQRGKF